MKFYCIFLLSILFSWHTYAQKTGIEKLSKSKIDSLRSERVDTILWYHSYCGDCWFKKTDAPIKYYNCPVESGYDLACNVIIYRQKGEYFILNFDCTNFVMKRRLDTSKSIPYFVSIISTLNARDKAIKELDKKNDKYLLGAMQMDGFFNEADIYCNKISQHVRMTDTETTDKYYKKYFWIDKQIKLFELISSDIAVKKSNQ